MHLIDNSDLQKVRVVELGESYRLQFFLHLWTGMGLYWTNPWDIACSLDGIQMKRSGDQKDWKKTPERCFSNDFRLFVIWYFWYQISRWVFRFGRCGSVPLRFLNITFYHKISPFNIYLERNCLRPVSSKWSWFDWHKNTIHPMACTMRWAAKGYLFCQRKRMWNLSWLEQQQWSPVLLFLRTTRCHFTQQA